MQNIDKLAKLTEQAASAVNLLSPEDLSEVENLQDVLDGIKKTLCDINDGPTQMLDQVKNATSDSLELLQHILQQEVDESTRSIEMVCKTVSTIQNLIDQIGRGEIVPELKDEKEDSPSDVEAVSTEAPVISEEDVPLILDFITESNEHLESAEAGLLELEGKPDDKDIINQIFRGFHTIKGMAGFLNLVDIGSLAHSAENLLGLAREGELLLDGENTDIIFESMDMMKKMITVLKESIEAGKPVLAEKNLPELLKKLKASVDGVHTAQKKEIESQEEKTFDSAATPQNTEQDEKLEKILVKDDGSSINDASGKKKGHSGEEKIKVSTTRLDNLINMVGELVIAQLMVTEEVNKNLTVEHQLNSKVTSQSKIVRELQELSLSMRMVPIGGVFQKMTRLVRDLSHKAVKNVTLLHPVRKRNWTALLLTKYLILLYI